MQKFIVGITGGIGSGKSVVSGVIKACGGEVIDADTVAKIIIKEEATENLIFDAFGDTVFDEKGLNRSVLRQIIIANNANRMALNKIMWPLITDYIKNEIKNSKMNIIFVDAALLIESGLYNFMDYIILITADVEKRIKRIVIRDKLNYSQAKDIIGIQMSDSEKMNYVSLVIENNFTKKHLINIAKRLYYDIKEKQNEYIQNNITR